MPLIDEVLGVGDKEFYGKSNGLLWLDHSGRGPKTRGHRTAMTDEMMRAFAERYGLTVIAQHFRNNHDCISVLQKP